MIILINYSVEITINALAERFLLHFYRADRCEMSFRARSFDHRSDKFRLNYLAHTRVILICSVHPCATDKDINSSAIAGAVQERTTPRCKLQTDDEIEGRIMLINYSAGIIINTFIHISPLIKQSSAFYESQSTNDKLAANHPLRRVTCYTVTRIR